MYLILDIASISVNMFSMSVSPRIRPEGCCSLRSIAPLPKRRQDRVIAVLKALADPTRLEILRLVRAQEGATCVCDVVGHFDLAQPTISHHLKVLRDARLLATSRRGIWSFYEPDPRGLALLEEVGTLLD